MTIIDSGTVKYCTECNLKFDPTVSGPECPNCKISKLKPVVKKVEGKGK